MPGSLHYTEYWIIFQGSINDQRCVDDVLYQCHTNATWITDGTLCSDYVQQLNSRWGKFIIHVDNLSGTDCYGFFTDATASRFLSIGNRRPGLRSGQSKFLKVYYQKITTAVISCAFGILYYTYPFFSPCGYDSSIDFNQPNKKYTIKKNSYNCIITQHDLF